MALDADGIQDYITGQLNPLDPSAFATQYAIAWSDNDDKQDLQRLYTHLAMLDFELGQAARLMDTTVGDLRVRASEQFKSIQVLRTNFLARYPFMSMAGFSQSQPCSQLPSAYAQDVLVKTAEMG